MFETIFGSEIPLAARFFIAFLVVLALIALTAWLVRRFGANRLGGANARGRQPRLAVIDAASVDGRRRLVLIRRDNIEHLLMIGGPSDVVIEQNIVRAAAARDTGREAMRGSAPGETLPRAVPLGDVGTWPLQPHADIPPAAMAPPFAPALRATRVTPADDQWTTPEPFVPRPRPAPPTPAAPTPSADISARYTMPEYSAPPPPPPAPLAPAATGPARDTALDLHQEPAATANPATPQTDRNLAEMAQRLEAALRRPASGEMRVPTPDPLSTPLPPQQRASEAPHPAPRDNVTPTDAKPASSKTPFDNLEQEMANLLGRPSGKT
jgi:hypothetical protein